MSAEPKAALIDLGNVIASFSHERAARQVAALSGNRLGEGEVARLLFGPTGGEGLNRPYESGRLTTQEFWDEARSRMRLAPPMEDFARAWSDIFEIRRDVLECLLGWSGRCPLYLCSNTNQLHWEHVLRMEPAVAAPFRRLFLSYEMGARKPDAVYFERALADLALRPEDCLFVDDMEPNIESARRLGIRAIQFRSLDQLRAEAGI